MNALTILLTCAALGGGSVKDYGVKDFCSPRDDTPLLQECMAEAAAFHYALPEIIPSTDYEWQRHECAICGKTIWERVEHSTTVTGNAGGIVFWESDITTLRLTPERVEAEHLVYRADYRVCPYCESKYGEKFKVAVRTAAHAFVEDAKAKESDRRKLVAEQNTQEEVRRVEAELRRVRAQLAELTKRLEAVKE